MKIKTVEHFDNEDLRDCLGYNPQDEFTYDDIFGVLAVFEGMNDGPDWHWIVKLRTGEDYYLRGGCDYTGWDCQSWANSVLLSEENPLKRAMALLDDRDSVDEEVCESLARQILDGVDETWREMKNKEFGLGQQ